MYLYYDSNGVLQEQINDSAIVQGETCNIIYCYFDGLDLSGKKFSLALKKPDGTFITPKEGTLVTQQIPYNAKRDLRYFEYYTDYQFIAFTFDTYSDFDVAGLYVGNPQISGTSIDFYEPITFNVESNNITANKYITSSQFAYLLSLVQGNVYSNGVSGSFDNNVLTVSVLTGTGATAKADIMLPFSDYLPLSGGTMTGNLILYGGTGNRIIRVGSTDKTNVRIDKEGFYAVNVQETIGIPQNEADYLCSSIVLNGYRSSEKITLLFPQSLPNSAKTGTFATQEWVNNALLGYYTTTETDTEISNALSDYSTTAQMATAITASVNALLSSSNSWSGTNSFTVDPTFNGSPFVTESTFATVFNSSAITANDIVSKLGSTPVQQATHAKTADSTSTAGQPISLLLTYVDSETKTVSVPFVAKSSYYGIFRFDENTVVETGEIRTSLTVAGVESSTAFASSTGDIYFRVEVSYLGDTGDYAGKYAVVLTNLNLSSTERAIVSLPTYLIAIANNDSQFTAQGVPTASAYGTLQIVS